MGGSVRRSKSRDGLRGKGPRGRAGGAFKCRTRPETAGGDEREQLELDACGRYGRTRAIKEEPGGRTRGIEMERRQRDGDREMHETQKDKGQ